MALAAALLTGRSAAPPATEGTRPPAIEGTRGRHGALLLEEPAATRCVRELGAVEVEGDVLVPRGRTCRLEGTAVRGRVIVSYRASLYARDTAFGEGISAHSFRRIELRGGCADGRPRTWNYSPPAPEHDKIVDFVFVGGRDVSVHHGFIEAPTTS